MIKDRNRRLKNSRDWHTRIYKIRMSKGVCVGCKEPVFRRIIDGQLKFYKRCLKCLKRQAVAQEYQRSKRGKQKSSTNTEGNSEHS